MRFPSFRAAEAILLPPLVTTGAAVVNFISRNSGGFAGGGTQAALSRISDDYVIVSEEIVDYSNIVYQADALPVAVAPPQVPPNAAAAAPPAAVPPQPEAPNAAPVFMLPEEGFAVKGVPFTWDETGTHGDVETDTTDSETDSEIVEMTETEAAETAAAETAASETSTERAADTDVETLDEMIEETTAAETIEETAAAETAAPESATETAPEIAEETAAAEITETAFLLPDPADSSALAADELFAIPPRARAVIFAISRTRRWVDSLMHERGSWKSGCRRIDRPLRGDGDWDVRRGAPARSSALRRVSPACVSVFV